jgi:hypothetical protein
MIEINTEWDLIDPIVVSSLAEVKEWSCRIVNALMKGEGRKV